MNNVVDDSASLHQLVQVNMGRHGRQKQMLGSEASEPRNLSTDKKNANFTYPRCS